MYIPIYHYIYLCIYIGYKCTYMCMCIHRFIRTLKYKFVWGHPPFFLISQKVRGGFEWPFVMDTIYDGFRIHAFSFCQPRRQIMSRRHDAIHLHVKSQRAKTFAFPSMHWACYAKAPVLLRSMLFTSDAHSAYKSGNLREAGRGIANAADSRSRVRSGARRTVTRNTF